MSAAILACSATRSVAQHLSIASMIGQAAETAEDPNRKVLQYEVASVKQNKSSDGTMSWRSNPSGFTTVNISLQNLISSAYGIDLYLISGGPGWVDSAGFNVDAKVAGPDIEQFKKLTQRQRASMLQPILADRFKLKVHLEVKQLPVFELVVMKGGVKFKEAIPDPSPTEETKGSGNAPPSSRNGSMRMGPGEFTGYGLTMVSIAKQLSSALDRTVIDKTGLSGKYDIDLTWKPEEDGPKQDNGKTDSSPSLFTAVQEQLGLKLQSTKGPVETLVIDHAEKPSEN